MNKNFITDIIDSDIRHSKAGIEIHTRFPPEPNGFLHIGHAKSICLNFGIAAKYKGKCNLRFDDTNPLKEDTKFVDSIIEDVSWLGFKWNESVLYASDYFEQFYDYAIILIKKGKAYVDDQTPDEIRASRGTLTKPGKESPYRNRGIDENLKLFEEMRDGKFYDGEKVLRAKIDMAASNLNLRDPVMYRILHSSHHRTKDKWCIYPMYDFAHGLEDSIENITHSLCTLEFEDHRPLYDWYLKELEIYHPQQIEFARLNLNYTIMSKRKLKMLVDEKHVTGWDDPRMPTISGLRRRGYTPESIREFCNKVGIAKRDSVSEYSLLEHCLREDLNKKSLRVMGVLNPLKVVIENYPENQIEELDAENNPENEKDGSRKILFTRELWIEKTDFMEDPPKKFFRLGKDREVRLKHAYYIKCTKVIKDKNNDVVEVRCTYDPKSKGGWTNDGRKVRGTLHWVSVPNSINATVNIYDNLFIKEYPEKTEEGKTFISNINNNSFQILKNCKLEKSLINANHQTYYQFLRMGYFYLDKDSTKNNLVFNRTATLRGSFLK